MQFERTHRSGWLIATVVAALLVQLVAAQLTLAHDEREHGRERGRVPQTGWIAERDEADDDDLERTEDDDEHLDRAGDDAHLEQDADEDDREDENAAGAVDAPVSAPPAESTPATPDTTTAHVPSAEAEANVSIANFSFQPATVSVTVGGAVTWTNSDGAQHTATGEAGTFNTGALRRGESYSQVFDQPGIYTYLCAFHPEMRGTVIVSP
jgi:plastocyanin